MKTYCTCDRRRNDGWTMGPNGTFVCPRCHKISKRVWEVTQKSCEVAGSNPTSPDTIDVEARNKEMKEIEMNEHEHPAFESDNCPACGTSADLTTDPLIDEDAIKTTVQEAFDEANVAVDRIVAEPLPVRIRALREELGLSRKQVQDATGLGASVVWRAEQEGKDVGDEKYTMIWDMLTACQESGHFPAKERKSRKVETSTDDTAKARDEWMAKTWELRGVLDQVYDAAKTELATAREKGRATQPWKEIIALVEPHTTEH